MTEFLWEECESLLKGKIELVRCHNLAALHLAPCYQSTVYSVHKHSRAWGFGSGLLASGCCVLKHGAVCYENSCVKRQQMAAANVYSRLVLPEATQWRIITDNMIKIIEQREGGWNIITLPIQNRWSVRVAMLDTRFDIQSNFTSLTQK